MENNVISKEEEVFSDSVFDSTRINEVHENLMVKIRQLEQKLQAVENTNQFKGNKENPSINIDVHIDQKNRLKKITEIKRDSKGEIIAMNSREEDIEEE